VNAKAHLIRTIKSTPAKHVKYRNTTLRYTKKKKKTFKAELLLTKCVIHYREIATLQKGYEEENNKDIM
jgi:hypothetical protein